MNEADVQFLKQHFIDEADEHYPWKFESKDMRNYKDGSCAKSSCFSFIPGVSEKFVGVLAFMLENKPKDCIGLKDGQPNSSKSKLFSTKRLLNNLFAYCNRQDLNVIQEAEKEESAIPSKCQGKRHHPKAVDHRALIVKCFTTKLGFPAYQWYLMLHLNLKPTSEGQPVR